MEITTLFLVTLLCSPNLCDELWVTVVNNREVTPCSYNRPKGYCKTRISYYHNSTATFCLTLLPCGDVDPNPGPDLHHDDNQSSQSNTVYSSTKLSAIGKTCSKLSISRHVWSTILNLGINSKQKTHRGTRAGRCKAKHGPSFTSKAHPPCAPNTQLDVHLWNARSICNKTTAFSDYVLEHDIDLMAITETWLSDDSYIVIGELTPPGYSFINVPRLSNNSNTTHNYGGVGLLYKTPLGMFRHPFNRMTTFEHAHFTNKGREINIVVIYRPPPSPKNGFTTSQFLSEFETFICDLALTTQKIKSYVR